MPLPMEQSLEKLVSCETFDCGNTMSLGPMLFVDSLSTRLISSLKLACRSSPGDISCWSISDLSAMLVRNFDGETLFCFIRRWLNPAKRTVHCRRHPLRVRPRVFVHTRTTCCGLKYNVQAEVSTTYRRVTKTNTGTCTVVGRVQQRLKDNKTAVSLYIRVWRNAMVSLRNNTRTGMVRTRQSGSGWGAA